MDRGLPQCHQLGYFRTLQTGWLGKVCGAEEIAGTKQFQKDLLQAKLPSGRKRLRVSQVEFITLGCGPVYKIPLQENFCSGQAGHWRATHLLEGRNVSPGTMAGSHLVR